MEKLWWALMVFCAGIVGVCLFVAGYSQVRFKGKSRWMREFCLAVAIILAFLATAFYGRAEERKNGETEERTTTNEPRTTIDEARIKELIRQLGADDWQTRETATKELIKIGKPIEPPLYEALQSKDPEIRLRAQMIWDAIHALPKLQAIWQELTATRTQIDAAKYEQKINQLIDQIQNEKNLSEAVKLSLKALASIRLSHVNRSFSGAECYKMTLEGTKRMDTLQDLEQQYRLIEDMAKQGKINQETLNKVKTAIRGNYEALTDMAGLSPEEKDRLIDLVISLCGVEPPEPSLLSQVPKLEDTPEWKAVMEQWQVVSQLKWDQKTSEELEKIRQETARRLQALKGLVAKGYLSISLIALIEQEFEKAQEVRPLDVTCYAPICITPAEISWNRLKYRLPILEKVYLANRINYWTYQKIILSLKKDLAVLEGAGKEWYQARSDIKEAEIEALKKKSQELFAALAEKVSSGSKLSLTDEQKVKEWIKQLGADDWQNREAATQSLAAMLQQTPAVIPFLKEALKSADPEVRLRAQVILDSIGHGTGK